MNLGSYTQQAWVVPNLHDSIHRWIQLGAGPFFLSSSEKLPEREYRGARGYDDTVAAHGFLGTLQLELIQPTSDAPSIFREVLDNRGESLHHMQFNCGVLSPDDFDARVAFFLGLGYEMVHSLELPNVARIVFFDSLEDLGFFIELAERPAFMHQITLDMYKAHLNWDGTNPIRENPLLSVAAKRNG